jgi:hypothetical protein
MTGNRYLKFEGENKVGFNGISLGKLCKNGAIPYLQILTYKSFFKVKFAISVTKIPLKSPLLLLPKNIIFVSSVIPRKYDLFQIQLRQYTFYLV